MPDDEEEFPTTQGNAGLPVVPPPADSVIAEKRSPAELDARQERVRERRKPGGPLRARNDLVGDALPAVPDVPDVPATDCNDAPEG